MTNEYTMEDAPPLSNRLSRSLQTETIDPLNKKPKLQLLGLQPEILLHIMCQLDSTNDLRALMNTCRFFHHTFWNHQQGISLAIAKREFLPVAHQLLKYWDVNGMPWPGRIHMFEWTRSVFGAQNVPRKRKGRLDGTFPATGGGADGSNKVEQYSINFIRANGKQTDRSWVETQDGGQRVWEGTNAANLNPDRRDFGMDQLERLEKDREEIERIMQPLFYEEDDSLPTPTPATPAPPPVDPALNEAILSTLINPDPIYSVRLPPTNPRPKPLTISEHTRLLHGLYTLLLLGKDFHCGDLILLRNKRPHPNLMPHIQTTEDQWNPLSLRPVASRSASAVGGTGSESVPDSHQDPTSGLRKSWFHLDRTLFDYTNLLRLSFQQVALLTYIASNLANTWNYAYIFLDRGSVAIWEHLLDRFIDPQKVTPEEYARHKADLQRAVEHAYKDEMQEELRRLAKLANWKNKGFGGGGKGETRGLRGGAYKRRGQAWVYNGDGHIVRGSVVVGLRQLRVLEEGM